MPLLIITGLIGLWVVAMVTSYTLGGLIHFLPVAAVLLFLLRVRKTPPEVQRKHDGFLRPYKRM